MSNTIVTKYSNSSGNESKSENSLVLIINKEGALCVENDNIQTLLAKECENKSYSVVRVGNDGKPDDASDHSSDDIIPHVNLSVDAFLNSAANSFDKGLQDEFISNLYDPEICLIAFQNDHCYTSLTPSDENRNKLHDHTLNLKEGGIYSSNSQKHHIPSSKKITVLESKIIPKGKNIPYFNSSGACEILKGTDVLKRTSTNIISQVSSLNRRGEQEKHVYKKHSESKDMVAKTSSDNSSDNESINEDNDSDSDFDPNVSDDLTFDYKSKRKSLLKKDLRKILSRKIELKNNTISNNQNSLMIDDRHKRITKTYIKSDKHKSPVMKFNESSKSSDNLILSDHKVSHEGEHFKGNLKNEQKIDLHRSQKLDSHKNIRKEKRQPAHMTALLNDMTSLFSTPDVIRRVSVDSKPVSKPPDKTVNNSLLKKNESSLFYPDNAIDKSGIESIQIKNAGIKNEHKTYAHMTPKNLMKNNADLTSQQLVKNQKECLDVIHPLDDVSLAQLFQESNEMLSPVNIPMVLNPIQEPTQAIEKHDVTTSLHNNPNVIMPSISGSLNAPLSPTLDILSGIHPEEECLSEDLLRHVAQLVESSENLQEVIDKQVLGKVGDIQPKANVKAPLIAPKSDSEGFEPNRNTLNTSENEKTVTNINVPKKEPIQIVRSNGRIITLPPIEAPATRSSKRKSLLNASSEQINSSALNTDPTKMLPQTPGTSNRQSHSSHKQSQKSSDHIKSMSAQHSLNILEKKDDDAESDESWNSEDDPDRLWCICKQPHNNRFMICCDMCEDWFHGKCVNVTKAMGQEMEEKGIEWRCPNCVKKKALANQNIKQTMVNRKSTDTRIENKLVEEKLQKIPPNSGNIDDNNKSCIVCKKQAARLNSIYCSDTCILKHAQEYLIIASPGSSNAKNTKDIPSKQKSETRVIVYERKSGNFLAGPNAPTTSNLKSWLQEHPTYEVVRPNTINSKDTQNTKLKSRPSPLKVQSVLTVGQDKQMSFSQPSTKSPSVPLKVNSRQDVQSSNQSVKTPTTPKPQILKVPLKSPPTPKASTSQIKSPVVKSPTSPVVQKKSEIPRKSSTNSIRDSVKKALREQISLRMSESKDNKFTPEEILKFSVDTEYELYDLFKDVGAKYKARYRTLMFNLKDRKNLTLWQKICERTITPKQLVRSSTTELASQELAQWRDKETKHQLELIKKSELDLLSCSKTIVLKTHKGEEVMESKTAGTAELDPNVSVEDLVTELNKSVDTEESVDSGSRSGTPVANQQESRHSTSHHKHSKHKSRSHKSSRSNRSSKSVASSSKHNTRDSRRSDSRSHRRKSSNEKEKSSHKDHSKHHSDHRRSSHSRSKSRSKHSDNDKKRSRSHDKTRSSSSKDEHKSHTKRDHKIDLNISKHGSNIEKGETDFINIEDVKSPVIYDSKLSPSEDNGSGNLQSEIKSPYNDSPKTPSTPESNSPQKLLAGAESDQEPSSTVDSILSAVWSGSMFMSDIGKFNVTAFEVSGQSEDVIYELAPELDIVGRIEPSSVWDYINKMKKQHSKDILILRFNTITDEDKIPYTALFTYLNSRNRYGVITTKGVGIKDIYIVPLASHAPLPSVLLPFHGPGLEESRHDVLLCIIVKQKRKRASQIYPNIPSKIANLGFGMEKSYTSTKETSYTPPPGSPKRKLTSSVLSGIPLPGFSPSLTGNKDEITSSLASADDEPYSPGDSDSEPLARSNSPKLRGLSSSIDLHRKMVELERKIEEEKKQIENMSVNTASIQDEPYSPSRPVSPTVNETLPMLSNISIPSNLHEILASIQSKTKAAAASEAHESYVPTMKSNPTGDIDMRIINPPTYQPALSSCSYMDTAHKGGGKLHSLSEAELMSMVPDEELLPTNKANVYTSAPPMLPTNTSVPPPPYKKMKIDYRQPPPPGLDRNM